MGDSDCQTFYHYTSRDGKRAILEDETIFQSCGRTGDAIFGKGVYGTTMDPYTFSKTQLAQNNYDGYRGFWEQLLDVGRVDFAFKITLPRSKIQQVNHKSRDILLHRGHIDLQKYDYSVHKVHEGYNYNDDEYSEEEEYHTGYGPSEERSHFRSYASYCGSELDRGHQDDKWRTCEGDSGCWNYSGECDDYYHETYGNGEDKGRGDGDRDSAFDVLYREQCLELYGQQLCEQCCGDEQKTFYSGRLYVEHSYESQHVCDANRYGSDAALNGDIHEQERDGDEDVYELKGADGYVYELQNANTYELQGNAETEVVYELQEDEDEYVYELQEDEDGYVYELEGVDEYVLQTGEIENV